MAITPLNFPEVPQADIAGQYQKGLQSLATEQGIRSSQAAEEATRAGIPGIQAEAAIKQRAAAFQKWQTDNSKDFLIPDPKNPDKKKVDALAFSNAASVAGFHTEAQAVAAHDLQNDQVAQTLRKGEVALGDEIQGFSKKALAHAANLVNGLPEAQRAAAWGQYAGFADAQVPGTGKLFGEYDPSKVQSIRTATMDPKAQLEEIRTQQKHAVDMQKAFASPDSDASVKALRTELKKRFPDVDPLLVDKMSGPNIMAFPGFKEQVEREEAARIVTPETRIKAEETKNELLGRQSVLKQGADAAERLAKLPTIVGSLASALKSKYLTDGDKTILQNAIAAHETETGTKIDPETLQFKGVAAILKSSQTNLTPKIKAATGISETGQLSKTGAPSSGKKTLRVGDVVDGFKYNGGDPKKQGSWSSV